MTTKKDLIEKRKNKQENILKLDKKSIIPEMYLPFVEEVLQDLSSLPDEGVDLPLFINEIQEHFYGGPDELIYNIAKKHLSPKESKEVKVSRMRELEEEVFGKESKGGILEPGQYMKDNEGNITTYEDEQKEILRNAREKEECKECKKIEKITLQKDNDWEFRVKTYGKINQIIDFINNL